MFEVELKSDIILPTVFIDLYKGKNDSTIRYEFLASNNSGALGLEQIIEQTGLYKVIIQPEINASGSLIIAMGAQALYRFPVAG